MNTSIEQGDARSAKLQQVAKFNKREKGFVSTSIERFFRLSLGREKTAKVAVVTEKEGAVENNGDTALFIEGFLCP
jgi:hypothetical protein